MVIINNGFLDRGSQVQLGYSELLEKISLMLIMWWKHLLVLDLRWTKRDAFHSYILVI